MIQEMLDKLFNICMQNKKKYLPHEKTIYGIMCNKGYRTNREL